MWRRAVLEGLEQETEPFFGLLVGNAKGPEDLRLQFGLVDTDRATADLDPVPDQVIGLGPGLTGILRIEFTLGSGERMVQRVPPILVFVELEKGPVDDLAESVAGI